MKPKLRSAPSLALLFLAVLAGGCASAGMPNLRRPAPPAFGEPGIRTKGSSGPEGGENAGEPARKTPPWDVAAPPGLWKDVPIDTDEGTWMSVDVSPDGRELVFDLLGDIYALPIEGGEARALTSGVPWDYQPRYSPDGRWIAFTSDRGGGDNVWVMGRDGSEPRALTEESYRLVSSPVWTPDGQFVAVRKHFTGRRSLGAGEVWLYHRAGGFEGVQVTKRKNDQKDLGEPAFSPDGRYLYYSYDATPGDRFEYNKDPYGGIYAIDRLDLETGETVRCVGGVGGAIRPTPSPDGRYLAFVRRDGLKTALYLHEVISGAQRPLYEGLDRDLQETWAIHGVYPAMAWTPDSKSVVFWAGGHLRSVDVGSGQMREIPFHVRDARQVARALRYPVDVAPERFEVRALRWVQVAPDGGAVVYQALGKLWIRDLPEGEPRRLTRQEDHVELFPSWSRDGKRIVYTTWDDDALGTVRVIGRGGGRGQVITRRPGHYVEPAFSPDGRWIVYRRIAGGWLTRPEWSHDRGVFRAPAGGGAGELITREGAAPHFGADPERVFLRVVGEKHKVRLDSIALDGSDRHTRVEAAEASELRVSPDGRWLAFVERYHVYVAPLPEAGRPVAISADTKALPVAHVGRDGGGSFSWSRDARTLWWALGPELFERPLNQAFAFLAGAPEPPIEPLTEGRQIGFSAKTARPSGSVAFVGGKVVTMKGDEVIDDGVVLVEGDRIVAVGARDAVDIPAGARVVDAAGGTVLPGLVDVHQHGAQGRVGIIPERNWMHDAYLAFGVTTTHDPSNDTETIFAASELQRAGLVVAPRIFSTGTILYGADAEFTAEIDSVADARAHLRRLAAFGAFSVKSYNQPRREQRQEVIAAAREMGMMVVPEGGALLEMDLSMVVDGHTSIEHALPLANLYRDVQQLWAGTDVAYVSTLNVAYGGLTGETYWYMHTEVFEHERLRRFVPPWAIEPRARRRIAASDGDWNHIRVARHAKALMDAGVRVPVGAHGQREGLGVHWEMWSLAQGGFTPLEALRAGTLHGAWMLGLDGAIGSLEPGKLADVIVVDGDVLADLRRSEAVRYTMIGGRLFDAATMEEVGSTTERGPVFWQLPPRGASF